MVAGDEGSLNGVKITSTGFSSPVGVLQYSASDVTCSHLQKRAENLRPSNQIYLTLIYRLFDFQDFLHNANLFWKLGGVASLLCPFFLFAFPTGFGSLKKEGIDKLKTVA